MLAAARRHIGANPRSLPFTLTYLFDEEARLARLAMQTGVPDGHPVAPPAIALGSDGAWPAEGTRPLRDGKSVWCLLPLARYGAEPATPADVTA